MYVGVKGVTDPFGLILQIQQIILERGLNSMLIKIYNLFAMEDVIINKKKLLLRGSYHKLWQTNT